MSAGPKPEKRAPRPRKAIQRTPLARGTKRIARGKRPAKKRKTLRARLMEQADNLCGQIVRSRGACEACGSTEVLQWAHGYGRRYIKTRWSTWFTFCLCRKCHFKYGKNWEQWVDWMKAKLGAQLYDQMHTTALNTEKMPTHEIQVVIEKLTAELNEGGQA